jgi:hypothetical protein
MARSARRRWTPSAFQIRRTEMQRYHRPGDLCRGANSTLSQGES